MLKRHMLTEERYPDLPIGTAWVCPAETPASLLPSISIAKLHNIYSKATYRSSGGVPILRI
jgi:hypothetical protein